MGLTAFNRNRARKARLDASLEVQPTKGIQEPLLSDDFQEQETDDETTDVDKISGKKTTPKKK